MLQIEAVSDNPEPFFGPLSRILDLLHDCCRLFLRKIPPVSLEVLEDRSKVSSSLRAVNGQSS
jgi:hypothetical protein